MKFKKSDLGLYFASSLVGAGAGLLTGAFIASRLTGPAFIVPDEETWDEQVTRLQALGDPVENRYGPSEKIAGEKKPEKIRKTTVKIKIQDDPELAAFIAEWEPSTIQIEMVKKGLVTLSALEELMIKEGLAKNSQPYNYSGAYFDEEKPELADLAKLPEEEEVIDDRYQILRDPPTEKDAKSKRIIYWDPEDDSFYTLTRKKQPVPTDLRGTISDETWIIMVPYFDKGYSTLYVDDLETSRFYQFIVVPDDMEASSDNDRDLES